MGYINRKLEYAGKQYDIPYTRNDLAPVVQKLDSTIHLIKYYPADKYQGNQLHYPLDRDLSGGWHYPTLELLGPVV